MHNRRSHKDTDLTHLSAKQPQYYLNEYNKIIARLISAIRV